MSELKRKVAVVTRASRDAGRGIAFVTGEAEATVEVTGVGRFFSGGTQPKRGDRDLGRSAPLFCLIKKYPRPKGGVKNYWLSNLLET